MDIIQEYGEQYREVISRLAIARAAINTMARRERDLGETNRGVGCKLLQVFLACFPIQSSSLRVQGVGSYS